MNKEKILFYVLCIFVMIGTLVPIGTKVHGISLEDAALALFFVVYLATSLVSRSNHKNLLLYIKDFFNSSVGILMTLVIVFMAISVTYSLEVKLALTETVRFTTYVFIFFIIKYELKSTALINKIRHLILICIFMLSIFGIVQYYTGIDLDKLLVMDYAFGARSRIAATFGNPNSYAAFLVLFIFPVTCMVIEAKSRILKLVYSIVDILMLINIVLTFSRNAWLAFIIGMILLTLFYSWRFIIVFVAAGGISLFIPVIRYRLRDFTDMSQNLSRLHHWQTAFYMIKDHPLFGVGNGNYVSYYDSYIEKYPYLDFAYLKRFPTHNSYLKVISELGVIGAIPFLVLLTVLLIRVKKALAYMDKWNDRSFNLGFFVAVIAFLIMNMFDNLLFVPKTTVWFWIVLAMSEGFIWRNERNSKLV